MNATLRKTITAVGAFAIAAAATPAFALSVDAGLRVNGEARAHAGGASTTVQARAEARLGAREETAKNHADQEIDRRMNLLQKLGTNVQAMIRLSSDQKARIDAMINTQISSLSALRAKIAAETDVDSLKADVKSIAQSYRIFMLVIPQGHVTVAADKIKTTADLMVTFSGKLSTRIADAQAAGKDTASLQSTLGDMNAKTADAKVQADAAIALVANLTPDTGDQAKAVANHQALVDARTKIQAGLKDLQQARQDARTIVKGLKAFGLSASASGSADVPTR